jgi:hypothetical protein
MGVSESFWNQHFHGLTRQFRAAITEESFNLRVRFGDSSIPVGYDNSVRREFKEFFGQGLRGKRLLR